MSDQPKIDANDYISFGCRKIGRWGESRVVTLPKLCFENLDYKNGDLVELLLAKDRSHLVVREIGLKDFSKESK